MAPYSDCTSASWAGWGQTSVILGSEDLRVRKEEVSVYSSFVYLRSVSWEGFGDRGRSPPAGPFHPGVSVFSLALFIICTGGNFWTDRGTGPFGVTASARSSLDIESCFRLGIRLMAEITTYYEAALLC